MIHNHALPREPINIFLVLPVFLKYKQGAHGGFNVLYFLSLISFVEHWKKPCISSFLFKSTRMSASRLNKHLYTEITKLKLCNKPDAKARFLVTKSPFDGIDDDTQPSEDVQSKEYVIVGRIYPKSPIYNEAAFEIELVLPATFPQVPPLVRFLTRIYHPNVEADGE